MKLEKYQNSSVVDLLDLTYVECCSDVHITIITAGLIQNVQICMNLSFFPVGNEIIKEVR